MSVVAGGRCATVLRSGAFQTVLHAPSGGGAAGGRDATPQTHEGTMASPATPALQ